MKRPRELPAPQASLVIAVALLVAVLWLAYAPSARAQAEQCRIEPFEPTVIQAVRVPELPFAGLTSNVVSPVLAALAAINLATAVPLANLGRLVQQAITEPGLLLFRKRRRGFGTVFESLSKRPVDLALVRIIDHSSGRVMLTRVTDREGRFSAFLPAGNYRFAVVKRGYTYPSTFAAGETFDPAFGRIATGGAVQHTARGPLDVSLPVDAPEDDVSVAAAIRRHSRRGLQAGLAYGGLVLGALAVVYAWTWQAWALLGLHVLLFLTFRRLTDRPWGKPWGTVYDAESRTWLPRSVVRLLDARFGRVIETQVVGKRGEYSFVVGPSRFKLFTDREGYAPYRGDEFAVKRPSGTVYRDVELKRRYTEGTS